MQICQVVKIVICLEKYEYENCGDIGSNVLFIIVIMDKGGMFYQLENR